MQENNRPSVRENLEQMPTERLDELLNAELEREDPDGNVVRLILGILWEREKDMTVEVTPKMEEAWAKYQRNIAKLASTEKRPRKFRGWIVKAASMAAILCLLIFAIPQQAEAESLFEKLARLTDSIVEFFSPGMGNDNTTEYVFETDNPGLQQVYDAVVALGVTEPVVPMWLPEGYELVECKTDETSKKKSLSTNLKNEDTEVVVKYDMYNTDVSHEYHRENEQFVEYETAGVKHIIMRNNDRWVVIWFTESLECFLTLDCQEDTLYRILDSIYATED